jgi:hypothetical protein
MKKILYYIVIFCTSTLYAQVEDTDEKWTVTRPIVDEGDNTLFEEAKSFYDKFHDVSIENIKYTSSRIVGVPSGVLATHECIADGIYGKPKLLWLSKVELKDQPLSGYLVCTIYSYRNGKIISKETTTNGWLQGNRRFDLWIKGADSLWKVKLNINLNFIKNSLNESDLNLFIIKPENDPVLTVTNIKNKEVEVDEELDKMIIKHLESKK